jgi:hypothetical protein
MPIWLRNFTFKKINNFYIEENNAVKKQQGQSSSSSKSLTTDGKVTAPEFLKNAKRTTPPSYSTKASRK